MPNETAKILIQNAEIRRYTRRPVARCRPSRTAMYEASPIVNAGSRKWNATTNANCRRERKSGSTSIRPVRAAGGYSTRDLPVAVALAAEGEPAAAVEPAGVVGVLRLAALHAFLRERPQRCGRTGRASLRV